MRHDSPLPVSMLNSVAPRYPTVDAAVAEIACLAARLELPKGVVHVISDIHGEDRKLQHVFNIIPTVQPIRRYDAPRRVGDTERVALIRREIDILEQLVEAYRTGAIREARA